MTVIAALARGLAFDDRPPIGRQEAADAARRELAHAIYRNDSSWLDRLLIRILHWLAGASPDASGGAPSSPGIAGVAFLLLVVLLVTAVVWRGGRLQRNAKRPEVLDFDRTMTADDHRARANELAAAGSWREAVRERLRAVVRELEQRGLLDERPGRTATEIATEAGAALPAVAADLGVATRTFADVWYGDREATAATDAAMRAVDERLRAAVRSRAGAR